MLGDLAKTANLAKVMILVERAEMSPITKIVDKMIRANKLTQLEGPQNVGEFGENDKFGESGHFGEISPRLST